MIRDILVANPHAAKSKEVEQKLDERSNPLPEYMKDQIKGGKLQTSSKELLQMQKDSYKRQHDEAVNALYRTLLEADEPEVNMPTLVSMLSGTGDIRFDYDLVELYDATGQSQLADALLGVMDVNHTLDLKQQDAFDRFVAYRQMLNDWAINGKDVMSLDASDIAILEGYAQHYDRTSGRAMGLLELNGQLNITRPVVAPNTGSARLASTENSVVTTEGLLELFPNPATEYFTVRYRIDRAFEKAYLRITDIQGREVYRQSIESNEDESLISEQLSPGSYQVIVSLDGADYRGESLLIK